MKLNWWKIGCVIIVAFIIFGLGLFIGLKEKPKPEIQYIPGETVTDTLYIPGPSIEITPDTLDIIKKCIEDSIYSELWPEKKDTLFIKDTCYIPTYEDTTRIMSDWATRRIYTDMLFNDSTQGQFDYTVEVQYNRLMSFAYNFTPVVKEISQTKTSTKFISPFVGISYLTNPWDNVKNPSLQFNAGIFLKDKYGLNIIYQRGFTLDNDNIGFGFLMKF